MGRTKKIYEWLKDILWIINRQKDSDNDYIKINEKINITKKNISTGEIDFYPQITYRIGAKVKVYVPINNAWVFDCAEFTGTVIGSYISSKKEAMPGNDITYLIYAEYYEVNKGRKYLNKVFQISSQDYTICGIKEEKERKEGIYTVKDMYKDIKTFCNNSCILSDECSEDCPFYHYEANKIRKKHLS
jgi:hypothetical protein